MMKEKYISDKQKFDLEKTKGLIIKNLSSEMITSGPEAVGSISARLLALEMASNTFLAKKYDDEIERLLLSVKREILAEDSDKKNFSLELINEIKNITDIIRELI